MDALSELLNLGTFGVSLAELITALIPASWYSSVILGIINLFLQSLGGTTPINIADILVNITNMLG